MPFPHGALSLPLLPGSYHASLTQPVSFGLVWTTILGGYQDFRAPCSRKQLSH